MVAPIIVWVLGVGVVEGEVEGAMVDGGFWWSTVMMFGVVFEN